MALVIRTTGFEDYIGGYGGAYIKMLIMGPPGSGKTRSASFWPKPIYADCEKGRMSIADRNVPYAEIRSVAEMDELLAMLALECRKPVEKRNYQTLVIDTLDSFQRTVIQERLRTERKESLSGWADWGYLDAKMTQFVERLMNLQMNIIVNLHVKETSEGDDDSRILVVSPKLKGDLREQIAAEFDLVGYMGTYWQAENGDRVMKRAIRWKPEPRYPILKDRSGRLPDFTDIDFTDEDYGRIYYEIIGKDDFLDTLAASEVLETIEVPEEAEPVGANVQGGQIAKPSDLSPVAGRKAPAKKKAAATSVPGEMQVVEKPAPAPEPEPEPGDDDQETTTDVVVDMSTGEILSDGAMTPEEVAAAVGGEVLTEEPKADAPKEEVGYVCGSQPATFVGKHAAADGCGNKIEDLNKMNIALLRTKTHLCPECFEAWKAAN